VATEEILRGYSFEVALRMTIQGFCPLLTGGPAGA